MAIAVDLAKPTSNDLTDSTASPSTSGVAFPSVVSMMPSSISVGLPPHQSWYQTDTRVIRRFAKRSSGARSNMPASSTSSQDSPRLRQRRPSSLSNTAGPASDKPTGSGATTPATAPSADNSVTSPRSQCSESVAAITRPEPASAVACQLVACSDLPNAFRTGNLEISTANPPVHSSGSQVDTQFSILQMNSSLMSDDDDLGYVGLPLQTQPAYYGMDDSQNMSL